MLFIHYILIIRWLVPNNHTSKAHDHDYDLNVNNWISYYEKFVHND